MRECIRLETASMLDGGASYEEERGVCMNVESTELNIEYTGRGLTINPKQKALAESELGRIDKMLGGVVSAHVILSEDKYRQIAEVTVLTGSETLVATCEGTDRLQVLHDALRKIEQQAVKHKERKITVERHGKPDSSAPLIEVTEVPAAVQA
jgi:putative sigma-54 modulation protein